MYDLNLILFNLYYFFNKNVNFYFILDGLYTGNASTLLTIVSMLLGIIFEEIEIFLAGRFLSAVSSAISMCSLILFLQVFLIYILLQKIELVLGNFSAQYARQTEFFC